MIKTFLTNKGDINGEEIILKCDNETITESSVLAEMFNSHYIDIFEKTSGKKPSHFARDNNASDTRQAIDLIVESYLDHSTINVLIHHVLIRLLGEWREGLEDNFVVGGVFMDLSKTFD